MSPPSRRLLVLALALLAAAPVAPGGSADVARASPGGSSASGRAELASGPTMEAREPDEGVPAEAVEKPRNPARHTWSARGFAWIGLGAAAIVLVVAGVVARRRRRELHEDG